VMVKDVWQELAKGRNNILDLSALMQNDKVYMDGLISFISFEQAEEHLIVYINENGGFSKECFDINAVTDIVTLHNTLVYSDEFDDVIKQLLQNNQIVMEYL